MKKNNQNTSTTNRRKDKSTLLTFFKGRCFRDCFERVREHISIFWIVRMGSTNNLIPQRTLVIPISIGTTLHTDTNCRNKSSSSSSIGNENKLQQPKKYRQKKRQLESYCDDSTTSSSSSSSESSFDNNNKKLNTVDGYQQQRMIIPKAQTGLEEEQFFRHHHHQQEQQSHHCTQREPIELPVQLRSCELSYNDDSFCSYRSHRRYHCYHRRWKVSGTVEFMKKMVS